MSTTPTILTAACWRCNREKSDLTPDEWATVRQGAGRPWPVPHPFEVAAELVRHMPADAVAELDGMPWTEDAGRAAHKAVVRGREARVRRRARGPVPRRAAHPHGGGWAPW